VARAGTAGLVLHRRLASGTSYKGVPDRLPTPLWRAGRNPRPARRGCHSSQPSRSSGRHHCLGRDAGSERASVLERPGRAVKRNICARE
jgi:hypothetical protein